METEACTDRVLGLLGCPKVSPWWIENWLISFYLCYISCQSSMPFFASLKILGLLFCPHCRWQRRVPMDGKPPNWHQKCDPTTFGCSRESWSSFLPVLLWIFSSQMHNNRATEPQVPESRGLVNAAGDEDRLLARVERHGCNVSVVTLDIMCCVLSWPWK